jgi:aspartate/methionine/tyrosine aminotransferase
MNFSEFKAWRDMRLAEMNPVRLDCLNPFIAMRWTASEFDPAVGHVATEALGASLGFAVSKRDLVDVPGVRSALGDIFRHYAKRGWSLWLPKDVYPFYWEAARSNFGEIRSFPTLPQPDLSGLAGASGPSIAVVTAPWSPLGRHASPDEVEALRSWLLAAPDRILVLDTVYSYRAVLHPSLWALWETGRVIVLSSLSKTHLQRGMFGIAAVPSSLPDQPAFRHAGADRHEVAYAAIQADPGHGERQQKLFNREWLRLTPMIERITGSSFEPPENGYMACINANYQRALRDHNVLVVPGSVFGSEDPDISIATCLYEMSSVHGHKESK